MDRDMHQLRNLLWWNTILGMSLILLVPVEIYHVHLQSDFNKSAYVSDKLMTSNTERILILLNSYKDVPEKVDALNKMALTNEQRISDNAVEVSKVRVLLQELSEKYSKLKSNNITLK